jgi:methylated-DNA-[protein]-cysteine S-methyltransferase
MRVTRVPYAVDGWGVGELWLGAGGIVLAHDPPTPLRGALEPPSGTLSRPSSPKRDRFVEDLVQRIHSYFAGQRVAFDDVELDLGWCTPFQAAVAAALRAVPWGETVSYGELAGRAGYERAGRAAGSFCAANTLFLLVPCHRVVAANGIGSYGPSGLETKRRLLRLEGHAAL